MSQHGPIVVIAINQSPSLTAALTDAKLFPMVEVAWADASDAVARLLPAAIVAEMPAEGLDPLTRLANRLTTHQPYVPLILIDPTTRLPANAIPLSALDSNPDRLGARLRAALRVRSLHVTMLRRLADSPALQGRLADSDPIQDATVLLIGRGASYPALSVALGERMGIVGALSIEAAAKHLNARDVDGIVIGDGFTPRVVDAFLTVLAEDTRFRNLPVIVPARLTRGYDLPNLEMIAGDPVDVATNALPLIRQHAFEQRLVRTLRSIDAGGLLDPRTGLLTPTAFDRDFARTVEQTLSRGAGLSVARFTLGDQPARVQYDAARIIGRLMRRTDFATMRDDGSIVAVFIGASSRTAGSVARRLASVVKHTVHSTKRDARVDPHVAVETLLPTDSAAMLLSRLDGDAHRAAS
jgi:hypothetical protein